MRSRPPRPTPQLEGGLEETAERAEGTREGPTLPMVGGRFDPEALIGLRLGAYRIEELLGRGGMGTVFLARRADGAYDQRVAIKLLHYVDQEAQSIRRFERERQTLARLSHPNIARLLDGGTTHDGRPYLVMEYVDGEDLDRFCDAHRLDVASRLRLFLQVCAGVQHAHRHLVVHRDLKPGNILVTPEGEVKLLDFGIAKLLGELDLERIQPADSVAATERDLAASSPSALTLTAAGESAYTPGYASPEQLRGEAVSAASDVFALGLVLHELVVGFHPFVEHRRSLSAMADAIESQETPTPSQALATGVAGQVDPEATAAARRVDPWRLRRQIQGDLDAVLQKALAKDEARRYASAGELGADVERHLELRPVAARAGDRAYVVRRSLRRHRLAIASALVVVASLVAGLVATAWQARRAERAQAVAERRFDQVQELAESLLFDVHDAVARLPGATPVRHLLVERALVYLDSLRADAAGDGDLQLALADAYERIGDILGNPNRANLGDTEAASESYRTALALRLAQPPDVRRRPASQAAIARTHHRLGEMAWWTGDTEAATHQLDLAIDAWSGLAAADPGRDDWRRRWAESLVAAARVVSWNGDHDAALRRYAAAEELLAPRVAESPAAAEAMAQLRRGRGETLGWMGEIEPALAELARARDELAALSARDPLDAPLRRQLYLASLRYSSVLVDRSPEEAIPSFRATLEIARELAAADPANALAQRDLSLAHASLGDVLRDTGDRPAALEHFRQAEEIQRQLAAEDPHNLGHQADLANSAVRIGYLLAEDDELGASLASFDDALELRRPLLAADPDDAANRRDVAVIHSARGDVLAAMDDAPASCDAYRRSLGLWRELEASELLRAYDQPQLDYAAAQAAACAATPAPSP